MATDLDSERTDLLASLDGHRGLLRHTTRGLTDEQAAGRTTVSSLSVGGLIKHVALVERNWARFIVEGPSAMPSGGDDPEAYMNTFRMLDGGRWLGCSSTTTRSPGRPMTLYGRCPT